MVFLNRSFDKKRLKALLLWFRLNLSEGAALEAVEILQGLGFRSATQGAISLGLDDLKTPTSKNGRVFQAQLEVALAHHEHHRGNRTPVELFQHLVDTWHRTSQDLTTEVVQLFHSTERVNPVYMMAFSGARGNLSQVRQLVGMRGLMADPRGQIVGFPILSNFREGLTITEYFVSCYGARKGVVDTAIRTADAGYLTRRLADVSHHFVVRTTNCGTHRTICLRDIKEGQKTILPLASRLVGRVLGEHIPKIAFRNQEITPDLASKLASQCTSLQVRSPLSCSLRWGVCQLCYGWGLSEGRRVTLGEAVGIIAAQSIGEPGTQLTLRTFHTGGVFSGDLLNEIRAPYNGTIFFPNPLQGLLVRTPHGQIAFLTKVSGKMILSHTENSELYTFTPSVSETVWGLTKPSQGQPGEVKLFSDGVYAEDKEFSLQPSTVIFVRQKEQVTANQLLAEFSSSTLQPISDQIEVTQQVLSESAGQVWFKEIEYGNRKGPGSGSLGTHFSSQKLGGVWVLAGKPRSEIMLNDRKGFNVNSTNIATPIISTQNHLQQNSSDVSLPSLHLPVHVHNVYHDNHFLKYHYSLGYSQLLTFLFAEKRHFTPFHLKWSEITSLNSVYNRTSLKDGNEKKDTNHQSPKSTPYHFVHFAQCTYTFAPEVHRVRDTPLHRRCIVYVHCVKNIAPPSLPLGGTSLSKYNKAHSTGVPPRGKGALGVETRTSLKARSKGLCEISFANTVYGWKTSKHRYQPTAAIFITSSLCTLDRASLASKIHVCAYPSNIKKQRETKVGFNFNSLSALLCTSLHLVHPIELNSQMHCAKSDWSAESELDDIMKMQNLFLNKWQKKGVDKFSLLMNYPLGTQGVKGFDASKMQYNQPLQSNAIKNSRFLQTKKSTVIGSEKEADQTSAEISIAWWLQKKWKAAPGMLLAEPFFSSKENSQGQVFWLSSSFIPQKKPKGKSTFGGKTDISSALVADYTCDVTNTSGLSGLYKEGPIRIEKVYTESLPSEETGASIHDAHGRARARAPLVQVQVQVQKCKEKKNVVDQRRNPAIKKLIQTLNLTRRQYSATNRGIFPPFKQNSTFGSFIALLNCAHAAFGKARSTEVSNLPLDRRLWFAKEQSKYQNQISPKSQAGVRQFFVIPITSSETKRRKADNAFNSMHSTTFTPESPEVHRVLCMCKEVNRRALEYNPLIAFTFHSNLRSELGLGLNYNSQIVCPHRSLISISETVWRKPSLSMHPISAEKYSLFPQSEDPTRELQPTSHTKSNTCGLPFTSGSTINSTPFLQINNLLTLNLFWQPLSLANYPNKIVVKRWESNSIAPTTFTNCSLHQSYNKGVENLPVSNQKLRFVSNNQRKGQKKKVFVQKPIWLSIHISNNNLSHFLKNNIASVPSDPLGLTCNALAQYTMHPGCKGSETCGVHVPESAPVCIKDTQKKSRQIENKLEIIGKRKRVDKNDSSLDQHVVHTVNLPVVSFPYLIPSADPIHFQPITPSPHHPIRSAHSKVGDHHKWSLNGMNINLAQPRDSQSIRWTCTCTCTCTCTKGARARARAKKQVESAERTYSHSKCGTPIQGELLPLIRQSFLEEKFFDKSFSLDSPPSYPEGSGLCIESAPEWIKNVARQRLPFLIHQRRDSIKADSRDGTTQDCYISSIHRKMQKSTVAFSDKVHTRADFGTTTSDASLPLHPGCIVYCASALQVKQSFDEKKDRKSTPLEQVSSALDIQRSVRSNSTPTVSLDFKEKDFRISDIQFRVELPIKIISNLQGRYTSTHLTWPKKNLVSFAPLTNKPKIHWSATPSIGGRCKSKCLHFNCRLPSNLRFEKATMHSVNSVNVQTNSECIELNSYTCYYRLMQRTVEYPVERSVFNQWVTTRRRKLQYSSFSTSLISHFQVEKFLNFLTINLSGEKYFHAPVSPPLGYMKDVSRETGISICSPPRSQSRFNFIDDYPKIPAFNGVLEMQQRTENQPYRKYKEKRETTSNPHVDLRNDSNVLPIRNKVWIAEKKFTSFDGAIFLDWYAFPLRSRKSPSLLHSTPQVRKNSSDVITLHTSGVSVMNSNSSNLRFEKTHSTSLIWSGGPLATNICVANRLCIKDASVYVQVQGVMCPQGAKNKAHSTDSNARPFKSELEWNSIHSMQGVADQLSANVRRDSNYSVITHSTPFNSSFSQLLQKGTRFSDILINIGDAHTRFYPPDKQKRTENSIFDGALGVLPSDKGKNNRSNLETVVSPPPSPLPFSSAKSLEIPLRCAKKNKIPFLSESDQITFITNDEILLWSDMVHTTRITTWHSKSAHSLGLPLELHWNALYSNFVWSDNIFRSVPTNSDSLPPFRAKQMHLLSSFQPPCETTIAPLHELDFFTTFSPLSSWKTKTKITNAKVYGGVQSFFLVIKEKQHVNNKKGFNRMHSTNFIWSGGPLATNICVANRLCIKDASVYVQKSGSHRLGTGVTPTSTPATPCLYPGQLVTYGEKIDQKIATTESGQVLYLDSQRATLRKAQTVLIYSQAILSVLSGEWIKKSTPLMALSYQKLVTGDIVQGLPKIEQFFEAPLLKDGTFWSDSLQAKLNLFFQEHRGKFPLAEAVRKGFSDIQRVLVEGVQRVYISQGVLIADKHLEVIVRQMTCKGRILYSGDTGFLRNELVALDKIESVNQVTYGQKALYHPQVRGITDASLESESFLSAASFQETTRVLSRDAVIGKTDLMRGLKERVIVGELIQAGTGLTNNNVYNFLLD